MYNIGNWSKGETYAWWLLLAGLGGYAVWRGWLSPVGERMRPGDRAYVPSVSGPAGPISAPGRELIVDVAHVSGDGTAYGSVIGVEGLPSLPQEIAVALSLAGGSLPSFRTQMVSRVERKDSSGAYQPLTGSR